MSDHDIHNEACGCWIVPPGDTGQIHRRAVKAEVAPTPPPLKTYAEVWGEPNPSEIAALREENERLAKERDEHEEARAILERLNDTLADKASAAEIAYRKNVVEGLEEIGLREAAEAENERLAKVLDSRAGRLLLAGTRFFVVKADHPYADSVALLIRTFEKFSGDWTPSDERLFAEWLGADWLDRAQRTQSGYRVSADEQKARAEAARPEGHRRRPDAGGQEAPRGGGPARRRVRQAVPEREPARLVLSILHGEA